MKSPRILLVIVLLLLMLVLLSWAVDHFVMPVSVGNFPLQEISSMPLPVDGVDPSIVPDENNQILVQMSQGITLLDIKNGAVWIKEDIRNSLGENSPALTDKFIYTLGDTELVSLRKSDGAVIWSQKLFEGSYSIIDVSACCVVVNHTSQSITNYQGESGEVLWEINAERGTTSGSIIGNYLMLYNGTVEHRDLLTGKLSWDSPYASSSEVSAAWSTVFYFYRDHQIKATSVAGSYLWVTTLPEEGVASYLEANEQFVIGYAAKNLFAIDRLSGAFLWSIPVHNPLGIVVLGKYVYTFESFLHRILAVEITNGTLAGALYISDSRGFFSNAGDKFINSIYNDLLFVSGNKLYIYGVKNDT